MADRASHRGRGGARRAAAGAIVVALVVSACSAGEDPSVTAATTFLSALARNDGTAAAAATDDPAAATPALRPVLSALDPTGARLTPGLSTTTGSGTASVPFAASWDLAGLGRPWTYDGQVATAKGSDGQWRVHWQLQDVHPDLRTGDALVVDRTLPDRAPILDASGQPLATPVATVTVGIEPKLATDTGSLSTTLARVLHVDASTISADVGKAAPTAFVPVITLRRSDYEAVAAQIHDLPGTVFQSGTQITGPTPGFAQPLLGEVTRPTADALRAAGPGFLASDQIGVSGLQQSFNSQLAGTASATITIATAQHTTLPVGRIAGAPGAALHTTLDLGVQRAAESALAGVPLAAAIVAIRPSTGAVVAVANSATAPFDIALAGQYPPGSTFKIVTADAVLATGTAGPDTTVPCPGQVTIDGRTIPNENNFDLGTVTFTRAFANSCNTSFSLLSQKLPADALAHAAATFGFGAGWQLPTPSFSGAFTPATDAAGQAANAFGQGTDLVSPFSEALIAATVAHGSTPTPSLVAGQPATAKNPPPAPPAATLPDLRTVMRAVVTDGTATALGGVPGGPVLGKTGTAEHGDPPQAHSWFTGIQGDLAFAVFVENGQTSHVPSNPIAQKFLTALPR
ncbi:penicillin-binding transpeptidase domain-containing protein [Pseudonocardia sp.]|uniref:penicillin-binding transpeptidase domain-containing protein n=1 Tax=Pseudonocardia sp. TaxID=60912 RepID=UPI002621FA0D|nr:penicillin-binding transpeptidase domain-containing protein [Pseudonocardia sp.]MCW2720744.1 penicillin-binding protein transpeptidase [Pseudonocardia sp.]